MTVFDVAILGGGLVGCSAALYLRRRGASVIVLERGVCGTQASGVNYGGVRQQGRHIAEIPLARRSRAIWSRLPDILDEDCDFMVTGHLKLAFSDAEMADLEAYALRVRHHGLHLEILTAAEIRSRHPYLGHGIVGGSYCAEDGQANPRLVAPAFARAARRQGADIREHFDVKHARREGELFIIEGRAGERIGAHRLINATGAWGSQIAAWFGEEIPESVMAPNMCVTEPIEYFIEPNLGVCGGAIYIRQIRRGNVIFGAGLGIADREGLRSRPLADVTMGAARLAMKLVPRLRHALVIRTWTGIEGCMPDMLPVIGPSATTAGLYHAFGFSGHGFQLGPGVGAVLAELTLDGETETPIEGFRVSRFEPKISPGCNAGQHPARARPVCAAR
jgi:sarcosine oxidase subunit beta